jgi:hypothetical protein
MPSMGASGSFEAKRLGGDVGDARELERLGANALVDALPAARRTG